MQLSGTAVHGVIYVQLDGGVAAVTSTTGTAVIGTFHSEASYGVMESHPHPHTEFVLEHPARVPRFVDASHVAKLAPLDGVMLAGAVICPVAWGTLRRHGR